jgi:transposase
VLVTQLAEALPLSGHQIAEAFGMHPVTLSRFRGQMRKEGSAALIPRKSGPKGPSKLTPRIEARCRKLREQGLSTREIAKRVSKGSTNISHVSVASLFTAEATQESLALHEPMIGEAVVAAAALETKLELISEEAIALSEWASWVEPCQTRYAGSLMLYAALARLDLWNIVRKLGAGLVPGRWFGWADTLAMIVICFALRFRSIEDFKNGRRHDLGVLIGKAEGPSVLSLRAKIKALTESIDPIAVSQELFRQYLTIDSSR